MLVCELSNSQIRCSLPDTQKLKVSTATDLFVYEIPKGDFWTPRISTEKLFNIEQGLKDIQRNPGILFFFVEYFILTFYKNVFFICGNGSSTSITI